MSCMRKQLKSKKCRQCKEVFTPYSSLSVTCGIACAIAYTEMKAEKKLKRDIKLAKQVARFDMRARKDKLKTRSDYEKEAQAACNAYIRELYKDYPCYTCGTTNPNIQYCAGHFQSVGSSPELRYHATMNIRKQCNFHCNSQKSGNIQEYRPRLIKEIGLKNVEWLESGHKAQNRTIDDLKEIKQYYKEQLKLIKS